MIANISFVYSVILSFKIGLGWLPKALLNFLPNFLGVKEYFLLARTMNLHPAISHTFGGNFCFGLVPRRLLPAQNRVHRNSLTKLTVFNATTQILSRFSMNIDPKFSLQGTVFLPVRCVLISFGDSTSFWLLSDLFMERNTNKSC